MNRVAVHQSVLHPASPVACVGAARAAGLDSIGVHVASIADVEPWWVKGAGAEMLHALVDALLVSRVTALDAGRVVLDPSAPLGPGHPLDPADPRHRALDLAGRLGCQFVTVRAGDSGGTHDLFADLADRAAAFRVRPLLVPAAGTAVPDARSALAAVAGSRGGIVLDVAPRTADPDEVADLVVEAGDALGYVRVPADELAPDMGAATSLLATLPPQVPVVVGSSADGGAPGDRHTGPRDVAFLAACRAGVDRLLVHPRAVEAERGGDRTPTGS